MQILGEQEYKIFQREIIIKEQKLGVVDKFFKYHFHTPWLGLNERNYEKYQKIAKI